MRSKNDIQGIPTTVWQAFFAEVLRFTNHLALCNVFALFQHTNVDGSISARNNLCLSQFNTYAATWSPEVNTASDIIAMETFNADLNSMDKKLMWLGQDVTDFNSIDDFTVEYHDGTTSTEHESAIYWEDNVVKGSSKNDVVF